MHHQQAAAGSALAMTVILGGEENLAATIGRSCVWFTLLTFMVILPRISICANWQYSTRLRRRLSAAISYRMAFR
jgi:hypothetical protein